MNGFAHELMVLIDITAELQIWPKESLVASKVSRLIKIFMCKPKITSVQIKETALRNLSYFGF